ncbi:hypothetical protein CROQUDRAFT_572477 [Cronartium quercuum f. sp. fusiforme G11]|uniref:Uncharacterized protein n=1 Tax=Cronartium quercuum f. sp. fusiforme G11 TaxID=708437 RepID=A0A9P6NQ05_9BASI|nr:hypothetical protein CROQUDRAFT_572477 [Cronartium quercuum f. sp. fusiforme G11]
MLYHLCPTFLFVSLSLVLIFFASLVQLCLLLSFNPTTTRVMLLVAKPGSPNPTRCLSLAIGIPVVSIF